jgi:dTDP-4-dehydrorhamnose 3,5-epimerase
MSERFDIIETPLAGLRLLQRKPRGDARGYLERLFCRAELAEILDGAEIEQINHTLTRVRGTVRGLHFQHPPHAEIKLVTCLRGEVFDVAVDLRRGSPTFLGWHGERLSDENHRTLAIPRGFAHGFQTLTGDCEMLYLHSAAYQPTAEAGLNPQDPRIAIHWPLAVTQLSERDASCPFVDESFCGIRL